eukprot:2624548-Amphidinium_carterae.1
MKAVSSWMEMRGTSQLTLEIVSMWAIGHYRPAMSWDARRRQALVFRYAKMHSGDVFHCQIHHTLPELVFRMC